MNFRLVSLSFLGCILLYSCFPVSAQESKVFSGEITRYPDELLLFMQKNINPESQVILNAFITTWTRDSLFTTKEQEKIISTSANLLKKNAKPYPHFTHYLNCLVSLKKKVREPAQYAGWDYPPDHGSFSGFHTSAY
jgi:hypothetical protein